MKIKFKERILVSGILISSGYRILKMRAWIEEEREARIDGSMVFLTDSVEIVKDSGDRCLVKYIDEVGQEVRLWFLKKDLILNEPLMVDGEEYV